MLIFILLLTLITYSQAWRCGFVSDDVSGIKDFNGKLLIKSQGFINAVMDSLWFKICKKVAWRWHLVLLAYHLISVIIMFYFTKGLFGKQIAFVATSLFAIHPCNNQGSIWLSGRHYAIGAWLMMGAYMLAKTPFFLGLWGMGAFLHPQGAILPLILLLTKPGWLFLAYCGLILTILPYYIKWLNRRLDLFKWDRRLTGWKPKRINMLIKVMAYYLGMAFVPFHTGFYHQKLFAYHPELDNFNIKAVLGLCGLMLWGWLAVISRHIIPGIYFGLVWFFLFLIPCINIIHNNMMFSERYMYVPLVGFCIALGSMLILLPHWPIVFAVILTLYCVRTASYILAYQDNFTLWTTNIRNHPLSLEAHINHGDLLLKSGRSDLALPIFERATQIEPTSEIAWFNLGSAQANLGYVQEAEKCWLKAIELNPKYINPRYNLMRMKEELKKRGWKEVAVGVGV